MSEQPRRRRRQQMPFEESAMSSVEVVVEAAVPNTEIIAPSIPRSFSYDTAIPNTRTKTGLLEYIKTVIELETDLAAHDRILTEVYTDINKRKPILKLEELPEIPQYRGINDGVRTAGYALCASAVVLFFLLWFMSGSLIPGSVLAVPFAVSGLFCLGYMKSLEKDNDRLLNNYEAGKKFIQERNNKAQVTYSSAVRECNDSYDAILAKIQPCIDETRNVLNRLYSMDIIYPKYRSLPALTSIYEYLITGRCEEITGPHGAYNLYEDELRKDTVISQLNTVIENLEQIRQNQYMLYEQVCAIQQNTAAIRSELAQIKGYTIQIAELAKLNAYYAARTEANTRITMYYHL